MSALDIRVGDVVRLKPMTIVSLPPRGGFMARYDNPSDSDGESRGSAHLYFDTVESIISRAETDAEKIARLEAENAELKARLEPRPLWYPPSDDRFGPWIDGPPPKGKSHTYQTLLAEEREKQCFDDAATPYPELFQMAVAHRVFLGGF